MLWILLIIKSSINVIKGKDNSNYQKKKDMNIIISASK